MSDRVALIEERLRSTLMPERLEIIDDSAAHAGHAGAREGGHFTIHMVSSAFAGKTLIQRHRLINAAVADLMRREIHALSIKTAISPAEQDLHQHQGTRPRLNSPPLKTTQPLEITNE